MARDTVATANEVCQWLDYQRLGWPKSVTNSEGVDVYTAAIDIINRQTKEIEKLRLEREDLRMFCTSVARNIAEMLKT